MTLAKILTVMLRSLPRDIRANHVRFAMGTENSYRHADENFSTLATFGKIQIFIIVIYMSKARKRRDIVA